LNRIYSSKIQFNGKPSSAVYLLLKPTEMGMTHDKADLILCARQTAYSVCRAFIARLRHATLSLEIRKILAFGAQFATRKHRVVEPNSFSGVFTNDRAAGFLPNKAKVLPSMDLNAIKGGPPC
jgi:hypothetical protein